MGFEVKSVNIDDAYDQLLSYADGSSSTLGEAVAAMREAWRLFDRMTSFQGAAALCLKTTCWEVHSRILDGFVELADCLKMDYAYSYMWFYYDCLHERGDACLPEDEIEQKRALLAQDEDVRLTAISEDLNTLMARCQNEQDLFVPAAAPLEQALVSLHDEVKNVNLAAELVEMSTEALFLSPGTDFSQLLTSMRLVIQEHVIDADAVKAGTMPSFLSTELCARLDASIEAAKRACDSYRDDVIGSEIDFFDRMIAREEERYAIFEEGRSQWELVGIGASVLGTLASAAAIVCTGGVATAVLAGAGTLKSGADAFSRIQDRASGVNASDRASSGRSKTATDAVKQAAGSSVASVVAQFVPARTSNPLQMLGSAANGAVSVIKKATQAGTILADKNHESMRAEAQASLKRIEELKEKRAAVA